MTAVLASLRSSMPPRTRRKRCRAFARACAKWASALFRPHTEAELATLDQHQRHAWERLPSGAKAQIARPS